MLRFYHLFLFLMRLSPSVNNYESPIKVGPWMLRGGCLITALLEHVELWGVLLAFWQIKGAYSTLPHIWRCRMLSELSKPFINLFANGMEFSLRTHQCRYNRNSWQQEWWSYQGCILCLLYVSQWSSAMATWGYLKCWHPHFLFLHYLHHCSCSILWFIWL